MLNPQLVLAMAEYLNASEALADATDDLIRVSGNHYDDDMQRLTDVAKMRLQEYRQARHNWENLQ